MDLVSDPTYLPTYHTVDAAIKLTSGELVVYPIIYRVSAPSKRWLAVSQIFAPSTTQELPNVHDPEGLCFATGISGPEKVTEGLTVDSLPKIFWSGFHIYIYLEPK